jgi:hypothetical protein
MPGEESLFRVAMRRELVRQRIEAERRDHHLRTATTEIESLRTSLMQKQSEVDRALVNAAEREQLLCTRLQHLTGCAQAPLEKSLTRIKFVARPVLAEQRSKRFGGADPGGLLGRGVWRTARCCD